MSSYIPIASQTVAGPWSSLEFTSIPTTLQGKTLRDLVLVASRINTVNSGSAMRMRFNNSNTGYAWVFMTDGGGTPSSSTSTGNGLFPYDIGFNSSSNVMFVMSIFDFAQTNKHKSTLFRADGSARTYAYAARWADTSAINSILIEVPNHTFVAGATFSLYGIEG